MDPGQSGGPCTPGPCFVLTFTWLCLSNQNVNSRGHIIFSLLASLFAHQSGQSLYVALEGCNRKKFYRLTFRKQKCLHFG